MTGLAAPVKQARASILSQYLQEVGQTPLLTAADEKRLATQIQRRQDARARQKMLKANLRLVVSIAKRYVPADDPELLLDLIQEGNIGLMRAVDRFRPECNTRFSTYGVYWIRQAILRTLKARRIVRLPESMVDRVLAMQRRRGELYQSLGRTPTDIELAADLGIDLKSLRLLEESAGDVVSLDQAVRGKNAESETQLHEIIEDVDAPTPDQAIRSVMVQHGVRQAVASLPARERRVIELRFGLQDGMPRTLEAVGKEFGISRERVRQLQQSALQRLRQRRRVTGLR